MTRESLGLRMRNVQDVFFNLSTNIQGDFQICISVPLIQTNTITKICPKYLIT